MMMKNFILILLALSILIASCGKDDNTPPTPKNIERALIGPEMIVQKRGVEYYVLLRYFKDYTEKDQVTLTVNGQSGTAISEETGSLTGTTMVFKFPALNQTGDVNFKLVIDNGQQGFESERTLRFIDDYTLPIVWNSLQHDYVSKIQWLGSRLKGGGATLLRIAFGEETGFGEYYLTDKWYSLTVHKPFIEGLSGTYLLTFNNTVLQQVKVIHGSPILDPNYNAHDTHLEIMSVPGYNFVSSGQVGNDLVTTYNGGEFTLKVHENEGEVYTVVTKQ